MAQQLEANHKEATPSRDNSTLTIFYTEELDDQVMVRLNLSDFFVYLCLLQLATCTFRRGDRYWSGSPQPIGIDFSAHEATAVHAGAGSENFTILARISARGSHYEKYIKSLYDTRETFDGLPSILTTKEDEELSSLAHYWYHRTKWLVKGVKALICQAAYYKSERLRNNQRFYRVCFPYQPKVPFVPRKPWSSNTDLRSQSQIYKLRWLRSLSTSALEDEDREFLLSVMTLLEEVKNASKVEHKVEITSATIVVPKWTTTRVNELFEEACALASIEVIGYPYDRVTIAAGMVAIQHPEKKKGLLVLDHGDYYLALYRLGWQAGRGPRGTFIIAEGMDMKQPAGTNTLENYMGNTLLDEYAQNYQADRFKVEAFRHSGAKTRKLMYAIRVSRVKIKYGLGFPEKIALQNRTILMRDNSYSDFPFNITGQHVKEAEENYMDDIALHIRHFLTDKKPLGAFLNNFPPTELLKLQLLGTNVNDIYRHLIKLSETSKQDFPEVKTHPIDALMVLDGVDEEYLLRRAAERALNWKDSVEEDIKQEELQMMVGICTPWEGVRAALPAKGASLRSRDWIEGYNRWEANGRKLWDGGRRDEGYVHYL